MADAESTLREVLNRILDEHEYKPREIKLNAITTGGANYTSSLYIIKVVSPNLDDLNLFAKVACIGETMRTAMKADWLFTTERFVYTELVKIYNDIQAKTNVPEEHRFVFPKFYGCNPDLGKETIVMENLVEAGFKTYNRFLSMDWEHASAAVDNLAKFHALSFAFEKYYPEKFEELVPNMKYRIGSGDEPSEKMKALWQKMVDESLEVLKEEQRDRVRSYLMDTNLLQKHNKPIGRPVVAHGDYRLSNLLFRRRDDNLQAIAVDYQTVHAGCPAGDLVYFIFMGSDEEFRRQHYEKLLDHYFVCLEQALERLAVELSVYTREKFDSDMKELLPYAVLLGVMVLPVVTVQADAAPRVDGDADINDFVMKPNELFAQRFNGIVNDCIRWGAI
ncbi:uncharacterized protein LOC123875925 isoform X2 [Maniola jurtina]|uniref:uncharacterized protein LOC123875925 isoform X2 n=1 Tax=Maniola jurtina TaxID=191418 RepID=UPI001E6896E2|nr:uncharacterized protein LOC123875925 isoform X2 [Maniola jurtina]